MLLIAHLRENIILASKADNERDVGVSQAGGMVGHPIDVALRAQKDEEKVEKEVDKDEEQLADVAERDGLGDIAVLDRVLAPERREPVPEEAERYVVNGRLIT